MAQNVGWINRRGASRTVPMKVLVLGFCRTGTLSMKTALEILGFKDTHHMTSVFQNPLEVEMWTEALNAKYLSIGKPYGRAEWDQLLGHCQAVTDGPSIMFTEELLEAYPDAKVILTTRDVDAWWTSYDASIGVMQRSRRYRLAGWLDPHRIGKVMTFARLLTSVIFPGPVAAEGEAKARFAEHYALVRRLVPPHRLLEYRVGEGWETLCGFLGVEVPQAPFPRTNDTKMMLDTMEMNIARIYRRALQRVVFPVAVIAAAVTVAVFGCQLWG
ncbi:P-loop containing nucleoside triphosphate hydrolase protein [Mycena leptocephala]|nr:P-loop containing nucleoside triphosphate hydrolase protein [Mycena leptocephala]